MDAKGVEPTPGMGMPSMMQQMMERMCCQGDFSPAAMCQRMMNSVRKAAETAADAAPEIRECALPPRQARPGREGDHQLHPGQRGLGADPPIGTTGADEAGAGRMFRGL